MMAIGKQIVLQMRFLLKMDVQNRGSRVAGRSVSKNGVGFKTLDIVYIAVLAVYIALAMIIMTFTVIPSTKAGITDMKRQ